MGPLGQLKPYHQGKMYVVTWSAEVIPPEHKVWLPFDQLKSCHQSIRYEYHFITRAQAMGPFGKLNLYHQDIMYGYLLDQR